MQDRIQIKHNGVYKSLPDFLYEIGTVVLEYKPLANQIQVKALEKDEFGGLVIGRSYGALKHDFGGDDGCR